MPSLPSTGPSVRLHPSHDASRPVAAADSTSSARPLEVDEGAPARSASSGVGASSAMRRRRPPPSFAESEFVEIVRRQRARSGSNALKLPRHLLPTSSPSSPTHSYPPSPDLAYPSPAFPSLVDDDFPSSNSDKPPPRLANSFEFAGWGTMSWLALEDDEVERAKREREEQMRRDGEGELGAWLASGVAGVAVAGSPLYAFPALVGIASVYSPISLLVATLLLSFWRPIMTELASALPISGANYAYLLNTSSSLPFALIAAGLTLLDDVATSVVAAATASSYIADQAPGIVGTTWMTILLLVGIATIGLVGVKGTASVTLTTLTVHLLTLAVLILSAIVYWARHGNETLRSNWVGGQVGSAGGVAKAVFQGICIAFLGVTGFETAPDYATSLRPSPHIYPAVLRSLQYIAIAINAPLLLCTFAVLPLDQILGAPSVLAAVGKKSAGRWLELWVTVDAVLILSATILAGLVSAIELLRRLALDGSLPHGLLKALPVTGSPALVVVLFTALSVVVYASSGASVGIVSSMFAIVFLSIMALYPLSLLVLLHNRPTLPRRSRRTPFLLIVSTLALSLALVAGVISTDPSSLGYFAAYVVALSGALLLAARWGRLMRTAWWVAEHGLHWRGGAEWCVRMMRRAKEGKEVIVFVKSDEINTLFRRILYVQQNETTSRIKLVHLYGGASSAAATAPAGSSGAPSRVVSNESSPTPDVDVEELATEATGRGVPQLDGGSGGGGKEEGQVGGGVDEIPSELEANFRLLDEAFPSITIDLVFLRAPFSPAHVHALARRLSVPLARMFMGCPSERWARENSFGVRELAGVRIISD
ncbi:hypothetical protein JCM8208_002507 [Rhodotorula glutinis]